MSGQEEECLSVMASSWSTSDTCAEMSEGYQTVDEIEEITEWEILDEVGESDNEDTTNQAQRLVVEELSVVTDQDEPGSDSGETTEHQRLIVEGPSVQTEHLDNITVTVSQDYWQRYVKASRLTKDLRLHGSYSLVPGPSGPSGDRETIPVTRILPDNKNLLPRGLKSYERLPTDLLPDDVRRCPICEMPKRSHIRRHILITHVPWFWSPTTACWICKEQASDKTNLIYRHSIGHSHIDLDTFNEANLHQWCHLMNGALYLLVHWFNLESLEDLFNYVCVRHIQAKGTFSEADRKCMTFYASHYSNYQVDNFRINPINHVICIMYTEIISRLLLRCRTERRLNQFIKSSRLLTSSGMNINVDVPLAITESFDFIDTHFHLDMLAQKLHKPTLSPFTFDTIQNLISPSSKNSLLFGIANYVFPHHWQFWRNQVDNEKIKVTFGIHPHVAARGTSNRQKQQLLNYIRTTDKCVAVGETGLDFTTDCACVKEKHLCQSPQICSERIRANQEEALLMHLQIAARENLPVVLHCRDEGNGSAAAKTLELIHQHGYVHLSFHRHCFLGSLEELENWKKLPHVIFGVTGKICTLENVVANNVAARISDHQLVLETDSPYLTPFTGGIINHPWNLIDIAIYLAKLRNSPLPFLIDLTNTNQKTSTNYKIGFKI